MPFREDEIREAVDADTFARAFRARLEAAELTGDKLVAEYRHKTAETLMMAGLCLIPSEHLNDNQFVVSRGIYDAAIKIAEGRSG